jgi:hypothetical protein
VVVVDLSPAWATPCRAVAASRERAVAAAIVAQRIGNGRFPITDSIPQFFALIDKHLK